MAGKFIVSERGQWDHPGEPTAVPTKDGRITMQGVPYPVMGYVPGYPPILMQPGGDYQFPGNMVYELPMAQIGLSTTSGKPVTAFDKKTADFYEKWKKPVKLDRYEERAVPTVEKEEDVPMSYRRNMGESTTRGIQTKLKTYDPSLEVDGVWGPLTEKAYRKYWNQHLTDKQAYAEEQKKQQELSRNVESARSMNYYSPEPTPQDQTSRYSFSPEQFAQRTKRSINIERTELTEQAADIASSKSVDVPGKKSYDFYNEDNPVTGKPLKNYTEEELASFIENQGVKLRQDTIGPSQEKSVGDYVSHYYDILSDPLKAARMSTTQSYETPFGFNVNVPDVPFGFAEGNDSHDPIAGQINMLNPLTYANAAGRLAEASTKGQTYYDLANLPGLAGKSFLGAVTGHDMPITDEQRSSGMRGLGTFIDALTVAPIVGEAAPFAKGFVQGSVPALLERATNAFATPTKALTQIERESLQMIQRANRFLAQNSTTASGNLTKKAVQNIMDDPAKLASLNSITEKLHPSVVKNMLGAENYSLIKDVIKTNTNGLGVGQLSKIEESILGARIAKKELFTPKALTPKNLENPSYMAGYNMIKPKAFVQNNELNKKATSLIGSISAKDANVTSNLRASRNTIDSAVEGELFVGSSNMSVDSYGIANKELLSAIEAGKVAVDDIVMAPLNNLGVATSTTLKSPVFYKAGLKTVNEEIAKLEQALGKSLPKAYFDATEQKIIAPYIVAKKIAAPSLKRVKTRIEIKEINQSTGRLKTRYEDAWRYIGADGSGLRPSETIIKEAKDYVPKFGTTTAKPKYKTGGQSERITSYNDFLNAYNS